MEVIKTIRPGKDGSKRYLQVYGEQLICVRYRRDRANNRNLVTVELIANQIPQPRLQFLPDRDDEPAPDRPVYLEIAHFEREVHARLRAAGGRWDPARRRWCVGFRQARKLRLEHRIDTRMSFGWGRNGAQGDPKSS